MVVISLIISASYLFLIGSFIFGFDKVDRFILKDIPAKTKFSIIIPFRNEANNLPKLLKSLFALNYSNNLFEVILVNDASEDNSVEIINTHIETQNKQIELRVIENVRTCNSPKKDVIALALEQAKHEWIITTDADCILPKFWLDSFDAFIQFKNPMCIVAPITYINEHTFLNRFQTLDLFSLQGTTIGSFGIDLPFLCNGANFGYRKSVFLEVGGFKGNTAIASGDDIFLLEKIVKKHPKSVHYLKCDNAVVYTNAQANWHQLISQRIRWAAKTSSYNNWFGKLTGLVVLGMNVLILLLPFLSFFGFFNIKIWAYIFIIKLNVDFILLYKTSTFFNQRQAFISFLSSFVIYPIFSVYVAFLSLFKGYQWKGRQFKK